MTTSNTKTTSSFPALTKEVVQEILDSQAPYGSEEEKETCERLIQELSLEEQEGAACTSYAYWFFQTYYNHSKSAAAADEEKLRIRMAMREARRHLVGASHEEGAALDRLRSCLLHRKERHVDLFRSLYPAVLHLQNGFKLQEGTHEEEEIKATMRSQIEDELRSKQVFLVRGVDRESRAVAIKMGRTNPETNHDAYVTVQLYVAERAIASTEFLSRGKQEKVLAVMDFEGYSSSNAPPLLTLKEGISLLQSNYPERLKTAIITEPAFWMRGLYNILYPLMSEDTRDKIQMAYGEDKYQTISALIAPEQAMPFMNPNGLQSSDVDVDLFLTRVPFHCAYNN